MSQTVVAASRRLRAQSSVHDTGGEMDTAADAADAGETPALDESATPAREPLAARIRSFAWRHRFLLIALFANAVLATALVNALVDRFEALLQRQRAERHFAAVRQLADAFIVDVHKALERVPGS